MTARRAKRTVRVLRRRFVSRGGAITAVGAGLVFGLVAADAVLPDPLVIMGAAAGIGMLIWGLALVWPEGAE